jgi:hypothetical protein
MVGEGVGDGDGDGEGVGVAVGVGVGEAVDVGAGAGVCACADEITPVASTNTMATSRAKARPALIFSACDAQRMNSKSRKSARSKKSATSRSSGLDLCPVGAERQSVTVLAKD